MLSVAEALTRILATADEPLGHEMAPLADGFGRTLAADLVARCTQPPFDVSAMDGFAVHAADTSLPAQALRRIGQSAAGAGFAEAIRRGEAVRIFTGAPVPPGADAILIQENAVFDDATVTATEPVGTGRHIRRAGLDFRAGEIGLVAGTRLNPPELALAAAMNHATVPVTRRPRVAILATGDELVAPGEAPGPDQIVASNSFAIAAIVKAAGGLPLDLGIVGDDLGRLAAAIVRARDEGADVLVTLGGASVGDHDLVQAALLKAGMDLTFWKIAMRPGKPLMHGRIGPLRVLGLPGNPVSSIVCGTLFVRPLVRALCGDRKAANDPTEPAVLMDALPANDQRQDYLRGTLAFPPDGGLPRASANRSQDSSMLRVLAGAGCLIVRAPFAPPADAGTPVPDHSAGSLPGLKSLISLEISPSSIASDQSVKRTMGGRHCEERKRRSNPVRPRVWAASPAARKDGQPPRLQARVVISTERQQSLHNTVKIGDRESNNAHQAPNKNIEETTMAKVDRSAPGSRRRERPGDAGTIMQSAAFQNLVRERSRFAWSLSIVMLVVYLTFICLVAFAHDFMATKVGGGEISLGIVLGLAVIIFAFILTGVYVVRANGRYDDLTRDLTSGRNS